MCENTNIKSHQKSSSEKKYVDENWRKNQWKILYRKILVRNEIVRRGILIKQLVDIFYWSKTLLQLEVSELLNI